jgi:hypothetical protein
MGAQGGEEVQCGTGDRAWRTLAGATLMILGGIGDLAGVEPTLHADASSIVRFMIRDQLS